MSKSMQNKGVIEVKCNTCGKEEKVATAAFYAQSIPAHRVMYHGVDTLVKKKTLRHKDVAGTSCEGTFSTVPQKKPRLWKASRDRVARGSRKG